MFCPHREKRARFEISESGPTATGWTNPCSSDEFLRPRHRSISAPLAKHAPTKGRQPPKHRGSVADCNPTFRSATAQRSSRPPESPASEAQNP